MANILNMKMNRLKRILNGSGEENFKENQSTFIADPDKESNA